MVQLSGTPPVTPNLTDSPKENNGHAGGILRLATRHGWVLMICAVVNSGS